MKHILAYFCLIMLTIFIIGGDLTSKEEFTVLKGPYLGQKPPGMMPEIFAPGIVSTQHKEHSTLAFSPDGTEIYWSIWPVPRSKNLPQTIMFMKIENGKWSKPQAAPFSGKYMDGGPAFFPDGKKLFFYSNRPIKMNGKPKEDSDCRRFSPKGKYIGGKRRLVITFKKDDNTWYETIEMGSEINISYEGARFPGMSPDGKYLFFTRYDEKWNEDIYWVDAKIIEKLKPKNL